MGQRGHQDRARVDERVSAGRRSEEAEAVNDVNPLYADGPLKGGDFAVPASSLRSGVCTLDGEAQVLYHFRKFVLFGRIIWIGAIGPHEAISDDDLFDLIVSDRAKQACEAMAEQWTT